MKSNTEFNKYKVKNDELYLPKSGGKVEGETVFTGGVRFSSGDPKNDLVIKDKRSLGTATGHEYDLEFNNDLDEVTLTEDSQDKTTLPLVATYNGTRANWNTLSAAEQAKYRHVIFKGESGNADISDELIDFTNSDVITSSATAWTNVSVLSSPLSLKTLFSRISQMFKNIRYLYNIATRVQTLGEYYSDTQSNLSLTNGTNKDVTHTIQNVSAGKYAIFYQFGNSDGNSFKVYNYTDGNGGYLEGNWSSTVKVFGGVVTHNGGTFTKVVTWRTIAGTNLTKGFSTIMLVKVGI